MTLDQLQLRRALAELPGVAAQQSLHAPDLSTVHLPRLHPKALRPDVDVVVGMRGAGKSLWTAVLADKDSRESAVARGGLEALRGVDVRVGFGLAADNNNFPSTDLIGRLLADGANYIDIWWAVVLHHALDVAGLSHPEGPWAERVAYWAQDVARREADLTAADDSIAGRKGRLLVLLDALDRVAHNWPDVQALTRAALTVTLALRSRKALNIKLFLRPDLYEDPAVWTFADSSKLRQSKIELEWQVGDLYALLWARLANHPTVGDMVASWLQHTVAQQITRVGDTWIVSPLNDATTVRELIHSIASPFNGTSSKRGYIESWIPLHLADAQGRISPRTWLLAFHAAAEETDRQRPSFHLALHYDGIQHGVVRASATRRDEIAEDHPWVKSLLEAARDLQVPCTPEELMSRWDRELLLALEGTDRLPPRRFAIDPVRRNTKGALIDDLVDLGVLYRTEDKRINIPDIFRVAFGIRRKGGVKPPR